MAQLAILGHATRGKEVIELLEMLGGKNDNHLCGRFESRIYFLNDNGYIESYDAVLFPNYIQLTLEQFLEKYPYKVGDKVQHKGATSCGSIYEIKNLMWRDDEVQYIISTLSMPFRDRVVSVEVLQPYEEQETMEEKKINQMSLANCDLDEVEIVLGNMTDKIIGMEDL